MNKKEGAPERVPAAVELDSGMASEGDRLLGIPKEYSGWDVYNNEAKKVDTELVNDWRDSLNSLLLFVSIFDTVFNRSFGHHLSSGQNGFTASILTLEL